MDLFGTLLGAAAINANARGEQCWSALQQQYAAQQMANQSAMVAETLPAGVFWKRTGGRTHRVVIRRQAEVVYSPPQLGIVA